MIYVNDFETGKKAIVDRYPELVNSQFKSDNSGWTNFALKLIINIFLDFQEMMKLIKQLIKNIKY